MRRHESLAILLTGRHRLPRHGGARAAARAHRPRGAVPRAGARRRRRARAARRRAAHALPRPRAAAPPRVHARARRPHRTTLPAPDDVDVVCHCAASISFDLQLEEAREINVDGTRAMLELAARGRRAPLRARLHRLRRRHARRRVPRGHARRRPEFRNTYEQTKCEAEHLVARVAGIDVAIARPSIVMGESDTGWTPAFNVLYWPLRAFARGLFAAGAGRAGRARRRRAGRLRRRRHRAR